MTTRRLAESVSGRGPGRGTAIAAALFLGLAGAWLLNWWAGAAILALGLVVVARPLDLFVSLLLVTAAAAFAAYGEASIKRDLTIVSALTLYSLAAWLAAAATRRWTPPTSRLADALAALAATSAIAAGHGLLAHHSVRFIFLELLPIGSLFLALALGGARLSPADLRLAKWVLAAVALVSAGIGYQYFAATGARTQGLPYSPVPGFIAVVVFALTLFEPAPRPRLVPVVLFCLLVGHQILTFTRGYWLALLLALPIACALYGRSGDGAGRRWVKVGRTLVLVALVMTPMVVFASSVIGWHEVVAMIGSRFASSFQTKDTPETFSNIVRLVEFRKTMTLILTQPWLGFGHGATLVVRHLFYPMAGPQWWVHQSYVMIWFKQGVFGLLALLWVLFAATRTGIEGTRHADPQVAGWCAASAACTVFAAVVGLTNYSFFMVTLSFLLALVWGISLSFARRDGRRLVWRARRGPDARAESRA